MTNAILTITPDQLAATVGVAKSTLASWRSLRRGPQFVETNGTGSAVVYRPKSVAQWLGLPPPTPPAEDGLLTQDQLATMLGVSVKTLRNWRSMKAGPPYLCAGKKRLYRVADVEQWLAINEVRFGEPVED